MTEPHGRRSRGGALLSCLPVALLFAVLLIWHLRFKFKSGDDSWFREILTGQEKPLEALIYYLGFRYNNWTSRLASEALAVTVTHVPMLWRVLDALILTGIPVLMLCLLNIHGVLESWAACACAAGYLKLFGK